MVCLDDATLDDFVHGRLSGVVLADAEVHLDACGDCSAIASVLAGGAICADGANGAESNELSRGDAVGRHVVIEPLGRGAMGVVYLAYDPELDRKVALKLVRPGASGAARQRIFERMLREAQATARLSHPNVVAIYDVGRFDEGVYLALEFVRGDSLREWIATSRSWREARDVLVQAGEGLAAAHEAGIVHRDFKPDNVIVGADGRVRVADFGLVRTADEGPSEPRAGPLDLAIPLTRTGTLLGTPAYMAPELLRAGEATAASDQFAFGVTLYEALYGARPFRAGSIEELEAAIARGPSAGSAKVPRDVLRVVERALSPRAEDRFGDMRALLAALRGAPPRARWPIWTGALAALAASAIAFAVTARSSPPPDPCAAGAELAARAWGAPQKERIAAAFTATRLPYAEATAARVTAALDAYVRRWSGAHRATCEATHVRHEQSEGLLDARMHCMRRALDAASLLAGALERVTPDGALHADEALAGLPAPGECEDATTLAAMDPRPTDPSRRARLEELELALASASADSAAGDYTRALAAAKELAPRAEDIGFRPAIAEVRLLLATVLRRTGAYADAAREAMAALFASEASRADRTAARAWLEILATRGEQGNYAEVLASAGYASASIARIGSPPDLEAAVIHQSGVARTNLGELADARRDLERALSLRKKDGDQALDVARTLTALANLTRLEGDLPRALALHQEALAMDEALLGPMHPAVARHHHNIAGVLRQQGRLDDAQASYERALALEILGLGPRHRSVGRTENSIGLVYLERGDTRRAREHLTRAKDILGSHPDRALAEKNLRAADAMDAEARERGENEKKKRSTPAPLPARRPPPGSTAYGPAETVDTGR